MELFRRLRSSASPSNPKLRLTVLATEEVLPWPLQLTHPGGLWNALVGIPSLGQRTAPSIMALERPMKVGHYLFQGLSAIVGASVEQCEEDYSYPGRKPGPDGCLYQGLDLAERDRAERALWVVTTELLKITGGVDEAVLYHMQLADRLAELSRGVVLDEECRRYYLPGKWAVPDAVSPLDVREHVVARRQEEDRGLISVHTHGLAKFGLPEMATAGLTPSLADAACWLLLGLGQRMLNGQVLRPGDVVGERSAPLLCRIATRPSGGHFRGSVLELVDVDRSGKSLEQSALRGVDAYRAAAGAPFTSAGIQGAPEPCF